MDASVTGGVTFGERLAFIRRDRGLSQPQLARLVGVRSGTIGNWEVRARFPEVVRLIKISHTLGVSMDYLVLGIGEPDLQITPAAGKGIQLTPEKRREIMHKLLELPRPKLAEVAVACGVSYYPVQKIAKVLEAKGAIPKLKKGRSDAVKAPMPIKFNVQAKMLEYLRNGDLHLAQAAHFRMVRGTKLAAHYQRLGDCNLSNAVGFASR